MANTYLTRTPSSTGSQQKVTFSVWIKRCTSGGETIYSIGGAVNQNYYVDLTFNSDFLEMNWYDGSGNHTIRTNRLFRDNSAWYHLVVAIDTTQSTASNRVKIYVNGIQETSFSSAEYMNQNQNMLFNTSSREIRIGQKVNGSGSANMIMSHFHGIDGTAYDASYFGSTDSTTGEWKIKTDVSVTYGTNGFFILKDGNSVTDQSGNTNNFTVGAGTLTKTEDSPSNVFATANPLDVMKQAGNAIYIPTFSNGNLTISSSATNNYQTFGTIAVDTGKWYWETKATDKDGHRVGVFFGNDKSHGGTYYHGTNAFYIHQNGQIYYNGSNTTYMSALSDGDIVGVALDRTNGHIYMSKNGGASDSTWADGNGNNNQSFANAVSISTKLGVTMPSDITYPFFDVYGTAIMDINFGNGYFGTTAVASAGTNASGNGIFEYDVPTGYTALSTKGLNL